MDNQVIDLSIRVLGCNIVLLVACVALWIWFFEALGFYLDGPWHAPILLVTAGLSWLTARGITASYDFLIIVDWQGICFDIKSIFIELYHFVKMIVLFVIIILIAFLMLRTFYYGVVGSDNKQSKED